ncbi:hypothetical protein FB645_000819 [Coemansia sp. IMI 203386]|nr:hypothetical protein FB645_000819 [Coemansia sp. IMI 203386]
MFIEFVPAITSVDMDNAESGHSAISGFHPFLIGDGCLGIPLQVLPSILKKATMSMHDLVAGMTSSSGLDIPSHVVEKLYRITLCILALNSDHHTAWNWR